ncbi:hypothetical protein BN871_AT_00390 [Paenibacillus sp. P22]|nr:hypothetical protein BN871_AT_00390 [Paenibacillus sp. P22]
MSACFRRKNGAITHLERFRRLGGIDRFEYDVFSVDNSAVFRTRMTEGSPDVISAPSANDGRFVTVFVAILAMMAVDDSNAFSNRRLAFDRLIGRFRRGFDRFENEITSRQASAFFVTDVSAKVHAYDGVDFILFADGMPEYLDQFAFLRLTRHFAVLLAVVDDDVFLRQEFGFGRWLYVFLAEPVAYAAVRFHSGIWRVVPVVPVDFDDGAIIVVMSIQVHADDPRIVPDRQAFWLRCFLRDLLVNFERNIAGAEVVFVAVFVDDLRVTCVVQPYDLVEAAGMDVARRFVFVVRNPHNIAFLRRTIDFTIHRAVNRYIHRWNSYVKFRH